MGADSVDVAGLSLFEIVSQYAAFGNHWSGTQVDVATADWLMHVLTEMGGEPVREPWEFDRYQASATLICADAEVPVVPVWYSATGDFDTADFDLVRVPRNIAGSARGLDTALAAHRDRAVVLAVDGPDDLPVQCNRVPSTADGVPAVIVAANWYDRLDEHGGTLTFTGATSKGASANILASFGQPDRPVVRLTTPLTGWTPAAGERGTGLAVALALALDLAGSYRVEFSACAGHEIDHAGLHHHLAQRDLTGETAIHLGASVAAVDTSDDGTQTLGANRFALTSLDGPVRDRIAQVVEPANFTLLDVEPPWPGEGGTWRDAGTSVLSFLGSSLLFHVTDDVADKATTPQALQTATAAVIAASHIYLEDRFS